MNEDPALDEAGLPLLWENEPIACEDCGCWHMPRARCRPEDVREMREAEEEERLRAAAELGGAEPR